jgi:hypothetical protein
MGAASLVVLAVAVTAGLVWFPQSSEAARSTAVVTSPAPEAEPAADPKMQRWMASRARHEVALNNALALVLARTSVSLDLVQQPCKVARAESRALLNMPSAPDAHVDALARTGLTDVEAGAALCLKGDASAALTRIHAGLTKRQEVTNDLDEALEGEE